MNWVGGARSRLKTKDEKKRQKEFFEKMRYSNKVRRLQRTVNPTEAPPLPPASLDLLSLEAADFSATKFRKSDTGRSLRHKVKKVELDGGKGLFPSLHHRHHHQDLELPMSPCAPSKLHLQEPEREPMPSTSSRFTVSATETMEPPLHWTIPEEPPEYSQSSYYHSTPVPEEVRPILPNPKPQHPLKYQGKSSEDIFFSYVPQCQDVSQPTELEEHETSQYTLSDEETLSDEFDYSPLSTIPSQSSIASSTTVTTLSLDPAIQDTVSSSPAKTAFHWEETHSQRQINRTSSNKNVIDLTEDVPFPCKMMTRPKWENLPKDPRQMTLTSFIRKLQANKGADKHSDELMKKEKPTPHQTDLTCKEDDEFLSPFCQNVKPAKPARGQFYAKCLDSKSTLQPLDERNENLPRSATNYKVEVKEHPMENDPIKEECSYTDKGHDLMQVEDTHIAKDESIEKQTPTMSMSKVCQQVLREVLQLDSELQTNNNTVLQPTPETELDFSNFARTQKRNEMEQLPTDISDAKSKVHALEATTDCAQNTPSPEQHMPNENPEATTHVPKTPTNVQHHQPQNKEEDNKENESHTEFQQTYLNQLIKEEQREQLKYSACEDMQGKHLATANGQIERFNSTVDSNLPDEQTAVSICPRPDSTSLEFIGHSRGIHQKDQATQCLIIGTEPGQNKETQCSVDEFLPAASSSECSHDGRVKPIQSLRSDAYDECILS